TPGHDQDQNSRRINFVAQSVSNLVRNIFRTQMSGHEQFAEDLALYALSALEGEDRANLEKHLATCSACRLELEHLRGDGALLALSATGAQPPARARQRLLDA